MILKYFFAWFGMMVLAIINGGLRDLAYKSHVGDLPAHQISTVILIVLFAGSVAELGVKAIYIEHTRNRELEKLNASQPQATEG